MKSERLEKSSTEEDVRTESMVQASAVLRDYSGSLTPFLGYPEQRINRLGKRHALRLALQTSKAS